MKNKIVLVSTSIMMLLVGGCSTVFKHDADAIESSADQAVSTGQATAEDHVHSAMSLKQLEAENARLARENAELSRESQAARASTGSGDGDLLPPNAKPGECYARVLTPAKYSTKTERVEKKPASFRLQVIPPKYTWVEEKVLVKEPGEKLNVVPATYRWEDTKILVKEASEKIVTVPAKYKTVSEKILVKPAYSTWKKGKGPIQKVDNATGEIMCLVEVPAEYKTVVREVLVTPPTTKKVQIPAEYKIVKKRVLAEPEKVVKVAIPAEYRTVKVKKVLEPAKEKRIDVPAVFATVKKRTKVSDSSLEWKPILCETNTTPNVIRRIQQALRKAGFNPGDSDGKIGSQTMSALSAYQKRKGLASGQITMETLKALGVSY